MGAETAQGTSSAHNRRSGAGPVESGFGSQNLQSFTAFTLPRIEQAEVPGLCDLSRVADVGSGIAGIKGG